MSDSDKIINLLNRKYHQERERIIQLFLGMRADTNAKNWEMIEMLLSKLETKRA